MLSRRALFTAACLLLTSLFTGLSGAAPGDLDFTFGNGGKVLTDLQNGSSDWGYSVAVQADGKIVVAGAAFTGGAYQLGLARFTAAGAPDPSFGDGGRVTIYNPNLSGFSVDVAVQTDGKILVLGHTSSGFSNHMELFRFTSTGALDAGFGNAGKVSTSATGIFGMALQSDGKILVCGYNTMGSPGHDEALLMRFTASGVPDSSFGTNGRAVTALTIPGDHAEGRGVVVQEDGRIVVAGRVSGSNGTYVLLLRYTAGGLPDGTFGDGGLVLYDEPVSGRARAVALQVDGKILMAGIAGSGNPDDLLLARYTAAGDLDATFGTGGKLITAIAEGTNVSLNIDLQGDGKILVAGEFYTTDSSQLPVLVVHATLAAARITADGALDATYGNGGKVSMPASDSGIQGRRSALQNDGKLLFAGSAVVADSIDFALTRLTDTGVPDASFGNAGTATVPVTSVSHDIGRNVVALADGKLLVAGWTVSTNGYELVLVRYLSPGAVDPDFGVNGRLQIHLSEGNDDECGLTLQPDGKIVIAVNVWTGDEYRLTLVRCLPRGTLDAEFGAGGIVATPIFSSDDEDDDDTGASAVVQSDGKILVAGSQWNGTRYEQALARYTAGGELDASFGNGGLAIARFTTSYARGMALQPDGKILIAGTPRLVRYTTTGALDTTFGTGGIVVGSSGDTGRNVVVLSDGKILVSGILDTNPDRLILVRYTAGGAADTSFSTNAAFVAPPFGANDARGGFLAVQNDGKYLVSRYPRASGAAVDFAIARCTAGGALDTGFGTNGMVLTPVGAWQDEARAVVVQSDGKIVVAGSSFNGSYDLALVRYDPGPPGVQFTIGPVTGLTSTSATLNAAVNPGGTPATAQFRFGTTVIPITLTPADGTTPQSVSATLSNLTANTLYHWQITATNAGGLSTTSDITFRTLTRLQNWRLQWFGSSEDTGPGADTADPDQDGLSNLLEFACNSSPLANSILPVSAVLKDTDIEYTYTRSKAAVSDSVSFNVEYSASPAGGSWSSAGITQTILFDDGTVQQVKALVPAGTNRRRFVRLSVRRP